MIQKQLTIDLIDFLNTFTKYQALIVKSSGKETTIIHETAGKNSLFVEDKGELFHIPVVTRGYYPGDYKGTDRRIMNSYTDFIGKFNQCLVDENTSFSNVEFMKALLVIKDDESFGIANSNNLAVEVGSIDYRYKNGLGWSVTNFVDTYKEFADAYKAYNTKLKNIMDKIHERYNH